MIVFDTFYFERKRDSDVNLSDSIGSFLQDIVNWDGGFPSKISPWIHNFHMQTLKSVESNALILENKYNRLINDGEPLDGLLNDLSEFDQQTFNLNCIDSINFAASEISNYCTYKLHKNGKFMWHLWKENNRYRCNIINNKENEYMICGYLRAYPLMGIEEKKKQIQFAVNLLDSWKKENIITMWESNNISKNHTNKKNNWLYNLLVNDTRK